MARYLLSGLFAFSLLVAGGLAYLLNTHGELPVDPAWEVRGSKDTPTGAVTVRFSGTSTLLFSDGDTHWMVDGWFSRPGPLRSLLGKVAPDEEAIAYGLKANAATDLAAVIPVHSHYDHAMDAPEVARRTGALLMGSESTANIGRGWGLPEDQIRVFEDRVPVQIGRFRVTPIENRHFQFPIPRIREIALGNPQIRKPLVPPVRATDYRLGKAYVLHVEHPRGTFAIVGSAGYIEGALDEFDAEVVFLGLGGLGGQSADYREAYWAATVGALQSSRVIPIHYDSLTAPIDEPFQGQSIVMELLSGGEEATLPFLKTQGADVEFLVLPRFAPVVLFE